MLILQTRSPARWRAFGPVAICVLALLGLRTGLADEAGPTAEGTAVLKLYDDNRDGYVSLQEWLRHGGSERAFRAADANHDGRLDSAEVVKANSYNDRIQAAEFAGDAWITAKVKAALVQDDGLGSAVEVKVQTHNGTVRLSGFVKSAKQATRAAQIASHVDGVRKVVNALLVRS